jgi:hypothetical protein
MSLINCRTLGLVVLTFVLTACGGGGGSEGGTAPVPTPPVNTPPVSVPSTSPTTPAVLVSVQGTIRYERVNMLASGALSYSSISQLPVRGATVELLQGNVVLASTPTNASGQYTFSTAPANTSLSIRVRAELKQLTGTAQWDVTVRDNTNSDALYVLTSAFNSGTGTTQNLIAGSGWTGTSYTGVRSAGPFAILDTIYLSQQKVLQTNASSTFPPLQVFWSINNSTASGNLAIGNIGTSFFTQSNTSRRLYILGRQDDDTDEYDATVVAHEWGHYYQSAFSRDDSTGGRHGGGDDRLDRRIAFSEGWGNAWSGIALAQNAYRDSNGPRQASGFILPLDIGYAIVNGGSKGWFREQSIQYILWDLNRQAGFTPMHTALTSAAFKTGVPLSDIHSFTAAFKTAASSTQTAALNSLLGSESINSSSDAFGSNETNNGGSSVTLPYYRQVTALGNPVTLAAGQTVCVTSVFSRGTDSNKLGQYAYLRFSTPLSGNRSFTVSSTTLGIDTDFEVHSAGSRVLLADRGQTGTETSSVNLTAGEHVMVIYDFNRVAGTPCFTVSIQ